MKEQTIEKTSNWKSEQIKKQKNEKEEKNAKELTMTNQSQNSLKNQIKKTLCKLPSRKPKKAVQRLKSRMANIETCLSKIKKKPNR